MGRTKEFRRYETYKKLEKRIKKYYYANAWYKRGYECNSYAEYRTKVKDGELDTWLRTTAVVCSCSMCSGCYKYKRPIQSDIKKIIDGELPLNYKRKLD